MQITETKRLTAVPYMVCSSTAPHWRGVHDECCKRHPWMPEADICHLTIPVPANSFFVFV